MYPLDVIWEYARLTAGIGASVALVRFLSGRKETQIANEQIVECHDYVLNSLGDGDMTSRINMANGRNVRDQLTVEEAESIRQDAERRRNWPRNN